MFWYNDLIRIGISSGYNKTKVSGAALAAYIRKMMTDINRMIYSGWSCFEFLT